MPIFGVRIRKEQGGVEFENRYFINQGDMDLAQEFAGQLVVFEKQFHGTSTIFNRCNIWQLGASPRKHRSLPLSGTGAIPSSLPTALEMCVKMEFPATDTYPYYKEYRVAVTSAHTNTRTWDADYLAEILNAIEDADDKTLWDYVCTKDGVELGDPVLKTSVEFSQLHKRWYNKKPKTP